MKSPATLRVLQVITDTDRRGAQVFATDLAEGLSALGHHVTTVALAPGTRSPALPVAVLGTRARGLRTLLALRRAMASADVTVAHGSSTLLACAVAGGGRHRPFVYRQISDSRFWAPTRNRRFRVRTYLRRARHVVALADSSAATLHDHLGIDLTTVTVVPNAVPGHRFAPATNEQRVRARTALGLPDDVVVAVYVGALVPEKGVDAAIGALALVPSLHLLVAGDGPDRSALEQLAGHVAQGRVHFCGDLADTAAVYAAADIAVLPSKGGDSMPAALIEAGLCALPSVTCPVGAITEVVLHEGTGLVVPSGDVPALAAALARLTDEPLERGTFGAAAVHHCAEHFTIEAVAPQWAAVLVDAARAR